MKNNKYITSEPIKSDGGSSGYYTIRLPTITIETEDIIKYGLGNDFDLGNIMKCLRRIQANREGKGKEGNNEMYELRKIKYTVNKLIKDLV